LKDADKDGIPDIQDDCPTIKGTAATRGCPDKDQDGIADKDDKCPEIPGTQKYSGCPVPDTDGDGLNDENDKCPNIAGLKKYDGCPIPDTDKDGINDEEDKCPEIFGIAKYDGCPPPDRDHDGVADDLDKCPDAPGSVENEGCPEIKKEIIQKVDLAASKIQFQYNVAALTPESYKVLDDVIKLLKENPELNIRVEGHTSSEGATSFNMKLSLGRANIVKKYLESRGVESNRLKAEGFGSTRLLNKDKTPAEKALNRRVELKLSNQ
jgi:outer membrane protein OmpA-like peptidoglycan-associated protein